MTNFVCSVCGMPLAIGAYFDCFQISYRVEPCSMCLEKARLDEARKALDSINEAFAVETK